MPREIEYFDGVNWRGTGGWTSTRVAPTKNAPFAGLGAMPRRRRALRGVQYPTKGFAGLGAVKQPPPGKVKGLKVQVVGMSSRPVSKGELSTILKPIFSEHQFQVLQVGFTEDKSPVWVWAWDAKNEVWTARVMSGPFDGKEGDVIAADRDYQPTAEDTAELPKALWAYTAILRPTNLELPESKVGILRDTVRKKLNPLRAAVGGITTRTTVVAVDPPKENAAPAITTAAIIGVALTMLSWGSAR